MGHFQRFFFFSFFHLELYKTESYKIQMCSGITYGRVLNGELCAQSFQKLICSYLQTVNLPQGFV